MRSVCPRDVSAADYRDGWSDVLPETPDRVLCRLLSCHGIHRKRLRNDLAVVHDKRVGAQRDIISHAPGDVSDVSGDSQAPKREPIDGLCRQRRDEVPEEAVNLRLPAIDLGFGVEPRIFVVVTYYRGNTLLFEKGLQVVANNGFGDN